MEEEKIQQKIEEEKQKALLPKPPKIIDLSIMNEYDCKMLKI